MKKAWGPGIALLCAVPPVVLAIWAGVYLFGFAKLLDKPWHGLTFTYQAESGEVTALADVLEFDWRTGGVSASGVRLVSEGDDFEAEVHSLSAVVPLPWTGTTSIRVLARDAGLRVVRLRDGSWNFEGLQPVTVGEPTEPTAIEVIASDVRVDFRDEFVPEPEEFQVDADGLTVGLLGDDAAIGFHGTVSRVGETHVQLDVVDARMTNLAISGDGLDLLPLKEYFGQWEGLRESAALDWTAARAGFSGQVVVRAQGDAWVVRGDGEAQAEGLVWDGRRFASLWFSGGFTERGAGGRIVFDQAGATADAVGVIDFGEDIVARLEGTVTAASAASLRPVLGDLLPADVGFRQATFEGAVEVADTVRFDGSVQAAEARFGEYDARGLTAEVSSDGRIVRVRRARGVALGSSAEADFSITLGDDPQIHGVVAASDVSLMQIPGIPRDVLMGGKADVQALISGPLSGPSASLTAQGETTVVVAFQEQSVPQDVRFSAVGDIRNGVLELHAVEAGGELAALQGSGSVNLRTGALDLEMFASGVDLSALPGQSLRGLAYADLTVRGTLESPTADGFVEVYGGAIDEYTLPFVASRVRYANQQLFAEDLVARSGVSIVEGDGVIDMRPADWEVRGDGRVIDLMTGDFTNQIVVGVANGTWSVAGPFSSPAVEVDLDTPSLLVDRIEVRDVTLAGGWGGGRLTVERLQGTLGGGSLAGSGTWSPEGQSGLHLELLDASAWALRPYVEGVARIGGRLSGTADVTFLDGDVQVGSARLNATELSINREAIGGAAILAEADSEEVRFSAGLGSMESNYVIENGVYRFDDKTASADYYVSGGEIETIMRVAASLAENMDPEQRQRLRLLDGKLALDGSISARDVDGAWKVHGGRAHLVATELVYDGEPVGELEAEATREPDRIVLQRIDWHAPQAALRLNPGDNFIADDGRIDLDGELYNIDLNWFKAIEPELGRVKGMADVSFLVRGTVESPEIDATVATEGVSVSDVPLDLTAGPFFVREGYILAGDPDSDDPNDPGAGHLRMRDLEARLIGVRIPFRYPATVPRDEPVSMLLLVPDNDIREVSDFLGVDPDQSEGFVRGGRLEVRGTLETLETTGGIRLDAPRLKFLAFDTPLVDTSVSLSLEQGSLIGSLRSGSSMGGAVEGEARVQLDGLTILPGAFLRATDFRFTQQIGEDSRGSGFVNAELQFMGKLMEPVIEGFVEASEAALRIAGEFPVAEEGGQLTFNPTFDVELSLEGGQVANGPLEAQASGSGMLTGSLASPEIFFDFSVESGELNLPASRIRLERGGTARFTYREGFQGIPESHLTVNLNATTRVTADAGLGPQRYDIFLEISGDLMSDRELNIQASSDPPDLSQSQIMAILGQSDIISDITSVGFGRFEDQLKTILSSVAAPLLIGQLSRQIERTLGLDYFAVDLTGAGIGAVTIAKSLGNGFTIEYRRVLEQYALEGESLEEVKLTYRLPTSNPLLGRFTAGIAITREGLVRATLSYTRRF